MNRCVEALKLRAAKMILSIEAQKARENGMATLKPYIDQDQEGKIKKPWLIMACYKPTNNLFCRERELIAYLPTQGKFIPFPLALLMSGSSGSESTEFNLLGREGTYEKVKDYSMGHREYRNCFVTMVMASSGGVVCSVVRDRPTEAWEDYGPRSLVLFNPLTSQIVRREALSPFKTPISMSILQVRDHASSDRCRLFVALIFERAFIYSCEIYDVEARSWRRFNVVKRLECIDDDTYDEHLRDEYGEMILWRDAGLQDDDDLRDAHYLMYVWQGCLDDDDDDCWALMGYNVTTDHWMKAYVPPPPTKDWESITSEWESSCKSLTGLLEVWSWKGRVFLATSFHLNHLVKLSTAPASGFDVWELKVRSDESKANNIRSYFWDHISRTPLEFQCKKYKMQTDYYADEFFSTSGNLVWMTSVSFNERKEPFGYYAPHLVYDIEHDEWSQVPQHPISPERKMIGSLPLFMYEPSPAMFG